ncbi:glycosyltransferase family 4 protein [Salisaeta longa]|uniref:glycosyltransferase family 4 protein n=1 Tax=Salisaeta longa TaxID=503170 RepID=UPI00041F1654|nr:glycosyltransferase family 1 protein [Salisaeta longa]
MARVHPLTSSSTATYQPPKRVALFAGAYNHIADGVSLTLNRLVDYLERHGTEVRVFAPTSSNPQITDHAGTLVPVRSVRLPGRSDYRLSLGITPSVRDALQDFAPTLFHVATPDLLGRHALHLADAWNVPVVGSYHTHFSSYLKYYHLNLLEDALWGYLRRFYERCEAVYVPSTAMMNILRSHGITNNLKLWQRGVDTDRFTPQKRSMEWRRSHGFGDDEVVVTFVSRLVLEKGLDVYADVIERLEQRGISHRSLIVGDGPAREALEERLDNTVFTGYLEGDALATAYASSDVFLFPSDTETFGNVTLEAMASGVPTVCANAVGSRDLVKDGTTGRLCTPGDVDAFTEAVARLAVDDDLRMRYGAAAHERAQEFRWDAILGLMDAYYDEVLGRTPDASPEPAEYAASPLAA